MAWLNYDEIVKQKERVEKEINERQDKTKRKPVFNLDIIAYFLFNLSF